MLQKIRDNTQGIVAKVIVWFIIIIFSVWGLDTIVGNFLTSTAAISVNGVDISEAQIEALTQSKTSEFYNSLGEGADLSSVDPTVFREQAIDELVQREILRQSAKDAGMAVSTSAINQRIRQNPDFQVGGQFDIERYNLVLGSAGYSPNSYRAEMQEQTILGQILAAYSVSGFTTPSEINQLVALTHQKRSARFALLNLGSLEGIEVTDAEIETWYQDNQDDFLNEEQVQIEYLELNKQAFFDGVAVTEEQLRDAYDEEVAAFQAQTERRASHILFEAATDEEFAAAETEATAVKARLDAGEDFATLAMEFSDDTGSAADGGDVGYTTGENFVEEFETALRNLAIDQVSEPVRTEFGIHLIKLTEIAETPVPTFEERRAALEQDLKAGEAEALFLAKADELGNLAFESQDLQAPSTSMNLPIQRSDWFGRTGGTGITTETAVINAAFSPEVIEDRQNSELVSIDESRSVVLRVVEHQLPLVRALDEVRGEIQVLLQLEKLKEQVRATGETMVTTLQGGGNIDEGLLAQNASWTQIDAVERSAPGVDPEVSQRLFSMPRPAAGATEIAGYELSDGRYVVIELQSVTDGTPADFSEGEEQNMRNFISQLATTNDLTGFIENLEARADIRGRDQTTEEEEADL